tara:strand:- start:307 stop:3936 length:3630 start_codon:yes stop_codon:yes gene_type:complete
MPFTTVNLKSGQSVRVEHSEDATNQEIIQLAREEAAAQAAANPEQSGSLARTGLGIAGEIAIGEGAKLGGAAAGATIGAAGGPLGMAVGGGIGYLVGAISGGLSGSYLRQKVSRPGKDLSQGEMIADTLINLVPYGKIGKGATLATRTAQHAALGGAIGTGAATVESVIEQGSLPTMSELAKVGLTSSVLGAGFGMSGEAFAKSYEKFAGRRPERMMDALRKRDPDAVNLANAAESAAFRNAEQTNQKIQQEILNRREQFDDELIRLLQEQDQSSGGIFEGKARLKVVPQKVLDDQGEVVAEASDAYRALNLAPNLADQRIKILNSNFEGYKQSVELAALEAKVDPTLLTQRIDEYLHAKYAPTYNNKKVKIDGGAGVSILGNEMTNKNAENIVRKFEAEVLPFASSAVKQAEELSKNIRKTLTEGRLLNSKQIKEFSENPDYVPLQRLLDDSLEPNKANDFFFSRAVFKPSVLKTAKGDVELDASITQNLVTANIEAAKLAETNLANLAFKRLLEDPDNKQRASEIVKISKETASGRNFAKDAPVITVFDPSNEYTITKTVNGKKVSEPSTKFYLDFSDGVAPELGAAVRGLNKKDLGSLMKASYTINKYLGSIYTGYNPAFLIPNLLRDRVVSALNTYRNLDSTALRSILNPVAAYQEINIIRKKLFNRPLTAREQGIAAEYDAFVASGGSAGGIATNTLREIQEDIKGFDFSNKNSIKQRASAFNNFVRKANEMVEDSTRFSVYRASIRAGKSKADAAMAARNASFDPKKQGTRGNQLRALYLFSNPSIQSTKNFWRSLKDPKVFKPVLAATLGTAVLIETYNSMIDPDWRNKVKGGPDKSEWRLNKNLVVLSPFKNEDGSLSYSQFPLAHEIAPIWTATNGVARIMHNQSYKAGAAAGLLDAEQLAAMPGRLESTDQIIKGIGQSILDGYNPTGGSLIPTVPKRILELTSLNKDGLGREIVPEYLLDQNMAAYAKVHPWTPKTVGGEIAIELSKELENLGAPVSPEKLLYLFQTGFGGLGTEGLRLLDVTSKLFNREEIKANDIPVFRRFFGSTYADGFEQRTGIEPDLKLFEYEQNTQNSLNTQEAFDIITRLQSIDDPIQKQMALQTELLSSNKSVQRRVRKMLQDKERGITRSDKMIRKLGVENGNRARFYETQIEKMPPAFINEFLQEQKDKGILTKNVENQIRLKRALEALAPQSIINEN